MAKTSHSSPVMSSLWILALLGISIKAGWYCTENVALLIPMAHLPEFLAVPLKSQGEAPIISTLAGVICGFLSFFTLGYVLQAVVDAMRLSLVGSGIKRAATSGKFLQVNTAPAQMGWGYYPQFTRLWREFSAQLQLRATPDGELALSTAVPAEVFFTTQAMVNVPMRVEFFRHLPGILTGAGIVSTFAGILMGLTRFNPSVSPEQVTQQLHLLFEGVSTAFVASFFAIFTAILVTVVEKLILNWRYAQLANLQGMLDTIFRGGEGGTTIVTSTPHALPQAAADNLEALITDLTTRLQENQLLIARQLHENQQQLAAQLLAGQQELASQVATGQQELAQRVATGQHELTRQLTGSQGEITSRLETGGQSLVSNLISQLDLNNRSLLNQLATNNRALVHQAKEEENQITRALRESLAELREGLTSAVTTTLQPVVERLATGKTPPEVSALETQLGQIALRLDAMLTGVAGGISGVREELVAERSAAREVDTKISNYLEQGVNTLAARVDAVRGELAGNRQQLDDSFQRLFGVLELSTASSERALGKIDQALSQSGNLGDELDQLNSTLATEVQRVRTEVTSQGEKHTAALMAAIASAIRELGEQQQQAVTARDAFLLARIAASHGELGDRITTTLSENLGRPVEEIKANMAQLRDEQVRIGKQLSEEILNAFAAHLRKLIDDLVERLAALGEMIASERQSLADTVGNLLDSMAEVAKAGGEQLSTQLEKAFANSELRQNQLLEALVKLTADIRVDMNLLQEKVIQAGQEVSSQVVDHTMELLTTSSEDTRAAIDSGSSSLASEVKGMLLQLAEERARHNQQRDAELFLRLTAGNEQLATQLRGALQESLAGATTEVTAQVAREVQAAGTTQAQHARELADMVLAAMASKMEGAVGNLSTGITDLGERLSSERVSIRKALQGWVEELARTNREDSKLLSERIAEVITQVESRHAGILGELNRFGSALGGDLANLKESLLHKTEEASQMLTSHLDEVVSSNTREQSIFIEMLSERMDQVRKRLRIK